MFEEQLSEDARNILGLQLPTDPRWVDLAGKSIEEILTDHAYCEQKAATSCISLIQRYSESEKLVKELSPIVTEEWGHFRLVLQELDGSLSPAAFLAPQNIDALPREFRLTSRRRAMAI